MKYIKNILIIFVLSLFINTSVYALDTSLKIYDDADFLTEEEEIRLKGLIDVYINEFNIDLIVVTTKDNSSSGSTEKYAEDFYKNNNFGLNKNKDGILLILDSTSGEDFGYVYANGEAELIYDVTRRDKILDNIIDIYSQGYYKTVEEFIKSSSDYAIKGHITSEEPKKYTKIYDEANLLTENERELLNKLAEDFVKKYNLDLVIVTTLNNSSSGSTKAYAEDFYDYNGFGIGKTFDGILFLIDRTYGYNDTYFLTTGEAIRIYDDARIEYVLDDIAAKKESGYYAMFEQFIKSASDYASKGVSPLNKNKYINENGDLVEKRMFPIFPFILISLASSSIIVGILVFRNKMVKKATKAMEYLDQKTINYTRKEDSFVNTHTTRSRITTNSGGSGGGSSTSRGSSGRSHGGGGRRM
jgi:Beta-propeller domains of methanol dehydrogenase type